LSGSRFSLLFRHLDGFLAVFFYNVAKKTQINHFVVFLKKSVALLSETALRFDL